MNQNKYSTKVIDTHRLSLEEVVARANQALTKGNLVALPTDTVYGLAANATQNSAVQQLFALKQRAADNPLPILIADAADLARLATDIPPAAESLIERFWPGALTIVVRKSPLVPDLVTGGQPTVGLRVPNHDLMRAVLRRADFPVAVTSANLSGQAEAISPATVLTALRDSIDLLVDDGPCPGGVPSTVVDMTVSPPRILRAGPVTRTELEQLIGALEG